MNWEQIEGNWKQFKGDVREKWGKLTNDELDVIAGRKDRLAGKLQEKYGIAKEEVEKQLHDFLKSSQEMKKKGANV
ncbi:MAG: CsbD family protein [Deltaproteobacteria bacterium]|nr:CsbD family protein [Deltaproteobacteria bacterium]